MKRALFFPYPGNFGPLVNCCAIADELVKREWTVGFLYSLGKSKIISDNFTDALIYETNLPPRLDSARNALPSFRVMRDLDDFAYLFQFDDYDWASHTLKEQLEAIRSFKPDVIVGSWTFFTGTAGQILGVPVVQIFQSPMLPSMRGFRWWDDKPLSSAPRCLQSINRVLSDHGIPEIDCVEELTSKGDMFILPSLPELDPMPPQFQNACRVGHLTWLNTTEQETPDWLKNLDDDVPVIYAYDGGLTYGNRILEILIRMFGETNAFVIFSIGSDCNLTSLPPKPSNFKFEQFVPAYQTTRRSKIVVSHGAIGTNMCCLLNGVPSIMIPTNSEREYYSRRIEALGAGRSLNFDTLRFETFAETYEKITQDQKFSTCALDAGLRARALGGSDCAATLIEQLVSA